MGRTGFIGKFLLTVSLKGCLSRAFSNHPSLQQSDPATLANVELLRSFFDRVGFATGVDPAKTLRRCALIRLTVQRETCSRGLLRLALAIRNLSISWPLTDTVWNATGKDWLKPLAGSIALRRRVDFSCL